MRSSRIWKWHGRGRGAPWRVCVAALWLLCAAWAMAQPATVVSTAPSFTETVFALGAGKRLVAVSNYCHYPPDVSRLPKIGNYLDPNVEAIARLKPGLVLLHTEQRQTVTQLTAMGIRVLTLRNTTLEDTMASVRQIGDALGMSREGERLERELRGRLRAIEERGKGKPRRTLLFIVGRTPGRLDGMLAVGSGSYLNELMRIAGGRNVLDDSRVAYPQISLEGVIRLDPDVIVDMGDMTATEGVSEAHKRAVVRLWESQPAVRAVQQRSVFAVADDIFVVPGPRVVEAAEAFAAMLGKAKGR